MKKITYTLSTGATINGTVEDIIKIVTALGDKLDAKQIGSCPPGYYISETKGLVKLSEMSTGHVKNALLKVTREYYTELSKAMYTIDTTTFLQRFTSLDTNAQVRDLYRELNSRS